MKLLTLAIAPVLIIAIYVYFRDKYEKEPVGMLLKALGLGVLIVIPVFFVELFLSSIPFELKGGWPAFYKAFFVASFTEESFKYIVLLLLIWRNKNFNEKFDGIVYATFISLGFAAVENISYVFQFGEQVGYTRAILSVPAHAIFGISMGFYLGLARFYPSYRASLLFKSFFIPFLLHGIFDFILMYGEVRLMVLFVPFIAFIYFDAFRKIQNLSNRSIFRDKLKDL